MSMKYLRKATRMSKHRKPPSLQIQINSRQPSPSASSVFSDCDADDEGMSTDEMPSRPLSLAIPGSGSLGPYCLRRPTLQEILANQAPSPWTLSAFMAYLSQNHCLETLEFTLDAQRYTTHWSSLARRDPLTPISPTNPDFEYVRMLWKRLIDAYIVPNGPREVNLPSNVRDRLLSLSWTELPPNAAELEPAVKIIFELMDESVLVPFVYSVAPIHMSDSFMGPAGPMMSSLDTQMGASNAYGQEPMTSPPLSSTGCDVSSGSFDVTSPRSSQHSTMTAALNRARSSAISSFLSNSSSSSPSDPLESMTDDSTDSVSPSLSANEPMTPPSTPPTSHAAFRIASPGSSPHAPRENSGWKKMGAKFGWRKGSRPSSATSGTSSSRQHLGRGTSDDGSGSGRGNGL